MAPLAEAKLTSMAALGEAGNDHQFRGFFSGSWVIRGIMSCHMCAQQPQDLFFACSKPIQKNLNIYLVIVYIIKFTHKTLMEIFFSGFCVLLMLRGIHACLRAYFQQLSLLLFLLCRHHLMLLCTHPEGPCVPRISP